MRSILTVWVCKCAAFTTRIAGKGSGQALPGVIAERLDPNFLSRMSPKVKGGVILVTGTNGKTTTTKMISSILAATGERVLTNATGSNLKRGIVSAFVTRAKLDGSLTETIAVLEVDEANLRLVASLLQPKVIVVLNLFRDQLDRYGEIDTTARVLGEGIGATSARLVLNADDPLVSSLAQYASKPENVSYFGVESIDRPLKTAIETATDSDRCPSCGDRLEYSMRWYGHIGHWKCQRGHFSRPTPQVNVLNVLHQNISVTEFDVTYGRETDVQRVQLPLPGLYNVYNAIAALAVAEDQGVSSHEAVASIKDMQAAFGRVEIVEVDGRSVYILLIKNPAGFAQVLETFILHDPGAPLMVAINDLDADGRDVSWLWDVPIELLSSSRSHPVVASGIRSADMALRLHYAEIEAEEVGNLGNGVSRMLSFSRSGDTCLVLATYTAMIEIRKVLSKYAHMQEISR